MPPYVASAEVGLLHHDDTAVWSESVSVMSTACGKCAITVQVSNE